MPARPAEIPPIVLLERTGGPAYLLEWHEVEPGRWGALVAWIEWDGQNWVGRRMVVPTDELTRVEGQNYKAVGRWKINDLRMRAEGRGRPQGS